ncbi:hypothetical protein RUM43_002580 [Polyplax serrata]|uniref:Uncharacterized protein n=1 Tax=Polyplax serrata TaxID=468196 RepID=A0AAN8S637_POLSC
MAVIMSEYQEQRPNARPWEEVPLKKTVENGVCGERNKKDVWGNLVERLTQVEKSRGIETFLYLSEERANPSRAPSVSRVKSRGFEYAGVPSITPAHFNQTAKRFHPFYVEFESVPEAEILAVILCT